MASSSSNPNDWLVGHKPEDEAELVKFVDKNAHLDIDAINAENEHKLAALNEEGDAILALANQFLPSGLQVTQDVVGSMVIEMRSAEAYTSSFKCLFG